MPSIQAKNILSYGLYTSIFLSVFSCLDMEFASADAELTGKQWICDASNGDTLNCKQEVLGTSNNFVQTPLIDDFNVTDTTSDWGGKWVASPTASEDNFRYAYLSYDQSYYASGDMYLQITGYSAQTTELGVDPIGAKLYLTNAKKYINLEWCDTVTYSYQSSYTHRFQIESNGVDWEDAFGMDFPATLGTWENVAIPLKWLTQRTNSTQGTLQLNSVKSFGWVLAGSGNVAINNLYCKTAVATSSSSSNSSSSSLLNISSSSSFVANSGTLTKSETGDTNTYNWILLKGKKWLTTNLNYGAQIPSTTYPQESGFRYCYNDIESNCHNGMGGLYTWASAVAVSPNCNELNGCVVDVVRKGICPTGWHIPSTTEWSELLTTYTINDLKLSGFLLDNAGIGSYTSYPSIFYTYGNYGTSNYFWTASEFNATTATMVIINNLNQISYPAETKHHAASVRCVSDL